MNNENIFVAIYIFFHCVILCILIIILKNLIEMGCPLDAGLLEFDGFEIFLCRSIYLKSDKLLFILF